MFHAGENLSLSPEEFDEQLRGLSAAACHRLDKIARVYAARCGLGADDLLQEAVTRVFEGSRHCPRQVAVVPFLAQVMRSLCSDENKAQDRKPEHLHLSGLEESGFELPDTSKSPEKLWQSRQRVAELFALFQDDELAVDIIEYIAAGYTAEEIRKDLGLDQTTYDSKRRFIRRRIDRHLRREG